VRIQGFIFGKSVSLDSNSPWGLKMESHNEMLLLWGLGIDAWITIATVITIIAVMLFTKVRTDAVMLIAIGVLFITGVLDAKEMCSGFSAGTVVVTGVLAVVMAGPITSCIISTEASPNWKKGQPPPGMRQSLLPKKSSVARRCPPVAS